MYIDTYDTAKEKNAQCLYEILECVLGLVQTYLCESSALFSMHILLQEALEVCGGKATTPSPPFFSIRA